MQVNMLEAKSRLSELARRAEAGEEIIIARAGEPYMRLVPYRPGDDGDLRPLGAAPGACWIAKDFDAPLDDGAADLFEAGPVDPQT
ncbi:MAG: type II toxin-antitoxin system prevent-host-death family antitoxin [Alphaproteobacteria bacterium]|nr:type II toxin-antitoxin system prevent-host-death family antitoxin [Alphaproteobacteria bacterium]